LRRRDLVASLAATAVWPFAAGAQQLDSMRRVGVLLAFPEDYPTSRAMASAFAEGLSRLGWQENKNIEITYRFAAGNPALFSSYAAELVSKAPDVLLASTLPAVVALRKLTHTIPIVFVLLPDPVGLGFVQSLARPGGNLTGFSSYDPPVMEKWLQLLKEAAPDVTRVAVIFNPKTAPHAASFGNAIDLAAPLLGVTVTQAPVHDDAEIDAAIDAFARQPGGGLIALPDSFNTTHHDAIISGAARHGLPTIGTREFPPAGGLMAYVFDPVELHAQAASYIDRILKGTSPADLPVQEPTKYSLIINLKTAKALGITVPQSFLARADEVIE
jgi:putative ABC transport system substrate-binding protein